MTLCDNNLMDHKRDDHNSGNIFCRYFKEGDCHYADEEKGGCWYLHTQGKNKSLNEGEFSCKI